MKVISLLGACLCTLLSACGVRVLNNNESSVNFRLDNTKRETEIVLSPVVEFSSRSPVQYDIFNEISDYYSDNSYGRTQSSQHVFAVAYDYTRIYGYDPLNGDSCTITTTNVVSANNLTDNLSYYLYTWLNSHISTDVDIYEFYYIKLSPYQDYASTYFATSISIIRAFNTYSCGGLYFNSRNHSTQSDKFGLATRTPSSTQYVTYLNFFGDSSYSFGARFFNEYWTEQIPYYLVNESHESLESNYSGFYLSQVCTEYLNYYSGLWLANDNTTGFQPYYILYSNLNEVVGGDYSEGFNAGYESGYENGYAEGGSQTSTSAYDAGYQAGLAAENDYTFMALFAAIADTPVLIFRKLFSFDLFGTPALVVIMSLFTALLLIFIAKKLIK